jgi:hypothetical protein
MGLFDAIGFGGPTPTKEQIANVLNENLASQINTTKQTCQGTSALNQTMNSVCGRVVPVKRLIPNTSSYETYPFSENKGNTACDAALLLFEQQLSDTLGDFEKVFILEPDAALASKLVVDRIDGPDKTAQQQADGEAEKARIKSQACQFVAAECLFTENVQTATIAFKTDCSQDETIVVDIQNKMRTDLNQSSKETKDFLATMAEGLDLGNQDRTIENVINKIVSQIDASNIQQVMLYVNVNQSMNSKANTSAYFGFNKQVVAVDATLTATQSAKIFDKLASEMEDVITQKLVSKNDTVGDFLKHVDKTIKTVSRQFSNAEITLFIVGIICFLLILGWMAFLLVRNKQGKPSFLPGATHAVRKVPKVAAILA